MKVRYIAGGILAAATLLLLARCSYQPPILTGIDCATRTDCQEASRRFNQRIHANYPIGSHQDALERDLLAQRFIRRHGGISRCTRPTDAPVVGRIGVDCPAWDSNWNPQQSLWFWVCDLSESLLCNRYASVVWSSDAGGRITFLNASIQVTEVVPGPPRR